MQPADLSVSTPAHACAEAETAVVLRLLNEWGRTRAAAMSVGLDEALRVARVRHHDGDQLTSRDLMVVLRSAQLELGRVEQSLAHPSLLTRATRRICVRHTMSLSASFAVLAEASRMSELPLDVIARQALSGARLRT